MPQECLWSSVSTCASVASICVSQNVIAMARYSAMAAESSVRAYSQRPVEVYRGPILRVGIGEGSGVEAEDAHVPRSEDSVTKNHCAAR
jgi:hypothetical protein